MTTLLEAQKPASVLVNSHPRIAAPADALTSSLKDTLQSFDEEKPYRGAMQESELSHAPDTIGRYDIVHKLGAGQYGTVYVAQDGRLDRRVAIKVLRKSARLDANWGRLLREARIAASLDHRYIRRVYDVGEDEGFVYMAMEYIDGSSLLEALDSGPLDNYTALRYANHICDALTYAHERGVIHGDIKAGNVLINADAEAKLADFGQAIAPKTTLDPQNDIWLFGVLLYQMVTGTLPPAAAVTAGNPLALPASASTGLAAIIERCMESNPARRYRTSREILHDLRIEADRPATQKHEAKVPQPGWTLPIIAGGAALTLLAIAIIDIRNSDQCHHGDA